MKQTTLKLNQVIPYSTTSQEYKLITDKLVNWIAMDTLPFTIVESPAFHELISSLNEKNNPSSIELEYLTENDWKQIDDLCVILKPLYIATKFLSSSSPTLSDVHITFTALIKELKKVIDGNNEHYLIADSVNHKLKEYWSLMENNTQTSSVIDLRNKLS
ncbi:12097_t:CDS:2, partial [Entrophospora sp. SA101]